MDNFPIVAVEIGVDLVGQSNLDRIVNVEVVHLSEELFCRSICDALLAEHPVIIWIQVVLVLKLITYDLIAQILHIKSRWPYYLLPILINICMQLVVFDLVCIVEVIVDFDTLINQLVQFNL